MGGTYKIINSGNLLFYSAIGYAFGNKYDVYQGSISYVGKYNNESGTYGKFNYTGGFIYIFNFGATLKLGYNTEPNGIDLGIGYTF